MADQAGSSSRKLRCQVVTPETTVLDTQADFVSFPAFDGEVGIGPGRAPLVARLGVGKLRLREAGKETSFFIDGGFGQVKSNVVTILTSRAKKASDLKLSSLEAELNQVTAENAVGDKAIDDKIKKLERLRMQVKLAKAAQD